MVLNLFFIFSFMYSFIFIDGPVQVTQLHFFGSEGPDGPECPDISVPDFDNIFLLKPVGPNLLISFSLAPKSIPTIFAQSFLISVKVALKVLLSFALFLYLSIIL